jgi:hypothetical protein
MIILFAIVQNDDDDGLFDLQGNLFWRIAQRNKGIDEVYTITRSKPAQ